MYSPVYAADNRVNAIQVTECRERNRQGHSTVLQVITRWTRLDDGRNYTELAVNYHYTPD